MRNSRNELRNQDNDRFEIKNQCYTVKVPVPRVVQEEYTESKIAYKTDADKRKCAEELRINAGTYTVRKVRQKTEEYDEVYTLIEQQPREVAYGCKKNWGLFKTNKPVTKLSMMMFQLQNIDVLLEQFLRSILIMSITQLKTLLNQP